MTNLILKNIYHSNNLVENPRLKSADFKGNDVILESNTVQHPALVRYAWSNITIPDLFNRTDLPVSNFTAKNEK